MANSIAYAELYQSVLAQKYTEMGKATDLVESVGASTTARTGIKWIGGKTVQIPRLTLNGLIDHDRNGQSNVGDVTSNYELKTMDHDRSQKFAIDPVDIEESGEAVAIANVSKVFTEEKVVPEIDTRVFSKIHTDFVTYSGIVDTTAPTITNILEIFDAGMEALDDAEVPESGRILYITPAMNTLLKNAEGLQRTIELTTSNPTNITRIIRRLDEVKIVKVPQSRFYTGFDYTEGFVPAVGAFAINLILLHPSAVISPIKVADALLDAPGAVTGGVYLWYYRLYMDTFLYELKANGVFINRDTVPVPIP